MQYRYVVKPLATRRIRTFYWHVLARYSNTYAYSDALRYINETVDAIYGIETTLHRRTPTISQWDGKFMAYANRWYFAYTIDGDTITVHDACHQQNMHDK